MGALFSSTDWLRTTRARLTGSAARRQAAADRDGEAGETLIELLATIILMGIAITALLTTTLAVIVSSHGHRRRVQAENEATTVVETIDRMPYVACAGPTAYEDALDSVPERFEAEIQSVRHLASSTATTASYQASCPGGVDQGAQQITVRMTSPGAYTVHADVVLVKRDDTCPSDPATVTGLGLLVGDRC